MRTLFKKVLIILTIFGLSTTLIIFTNILQLSSTDQASKSSDYPINYFFYNQTLFQSYKFLLQINQNLETSVKCVGSVNNQSCLFKNLYYTEKSFWIFTTKKITYPLPNVLIGHWNPYIITPSRRQFNSHEELNEFVKNKINPVVIPNLTLYFDQLWLSNIGHALFDGLYPAYLALIRFPPNHLRPFRILLSTISDNDNRSFSEDVYNRFAELGIMNASILEDMPAGKWLAFEELVMGSGNMCQRCIQPNLQLSGGVELNGSRLFRDRMYKQHGLTPPIARQNHSAERRHPQTPLKACIIHNKRFSTRDIMEIYAAIAEINTYTVIHSGQTANNRTKLHWPLVYVSYISYSLITSRNDSIINVDATNITSQVTGNSSKMKMHLEILQNIDIHIVGPGTGQMYQTFLSDGSVNINLGGLRYTLRNDTGERYTSFMEQQMSSGTPYIKGLYYPINERTQGIKKNIVIKLIIEAARLIIDGFSIPVNPKKNLAPDGQLFTEMCELDKWFCIAVTQRWPVNHNLCSDTWVEEIVHEIGVWSMEGISDGERNFTCSLNRTLLYQLKQKYNINSKTKSHQIEQK